MATGGEQTIIKPPNRKKYETDVSKISELIKEKEQQIDLATIDSNYNEELAKLGGDVELYEGRRSRIMAEMKLIDEKLKQLGSEISKHRSDSNKLMVGLKYTTIDKCEDQIKKLESEIQSGRLAEKEERAIQNEVSKLKESKPRVLDYQKARQSVVKCRDDQDNLRKQKDSCHHQLKSVREKLNTAKDKMDKCRRDQDRRREKQREKTCQLEIVRTEINELYSQRRQLNDDFRKHQSLYLEAMKSGGGTEGNHGNRDHGDHKINRELRRKNSLSAKVMVNVNQDQNGASVNTDLSVCHTLHTYFTRYAERMGGDSLTIPTSSRTPNQESPDMSSGRSNTPDEGTYKVLPRKKETEDEQWLPSTTKRRDSVRRDKRKSRKEKRSASKSQHRPLSLNPTTFSQFAKLGLNPPAVLSDIPKTLQELKRKIQFLEGHDSEAGDSGIMSSTGISEFSEFGINDHLTSGEVTPSHISLNGGTSPNLESEISTVNSTPMSSIKDIDHTHCKGETDESVGSDTPISTPPEDSAVGVVRDPLNS